MRIGAIADIHANRPALEAVLADMPPVDRIVCAGDVVGYYPWPMWCVEKLVEQDVPTVQGNHDRAVVTGDTAGLNAMARSGIEYACDQLDGNAVAWLSELPSIRTVFSGRLSVVHGHPDDPDRYTRPSAFHPGLLGDANVLVLGHTHIQHTASFDEGIVLNPGSVGQPRDGDPRAAYAIVDLTSMTVDERRVEYDIAAVRDAVRDAGLPREVGARLEAGY